jgi:integrase
MKYKILVVERGIRGGKFKKPLRIRIPQQQNKAEKKLLQYILESLNARSRLIPFTLKYVSTMEIARHLLFNRTGSPNALFAYINELGYFCGWMKAEPDQLMNRCRDRNGDANPEGMANMARALDEYVDYLQAKDLSPGSIWMRLKNITIMFRINGVGLQLPYGLTTQSRHEDRAPTREELQKLLDLANLRERVIITILAVSGLRVGTLLKLQYRHVKNDLERGIIPIHVHVEAALKLTSALARKVQ